MKKLLTNNLGLKLLSIFVAFAIWLVVVNIDDPVVSTTYSGVTVDVINGDSLTEHGKIYEILNDSNIIDVTITGKRSVVESIGKDNIKAVADIEDMSLMNTIEIRLSTNKNNDQLDSIKSLTPSVQLQIENLKDIHLAIDPIIVGDPAEGYMKGDVNLNQNTITVKGPESIIKTISKAEAEVNIGGRTSDITTSCEIKLCNEDGEEVESPYITSNIKNVNLSVSILATKAVDIEYDYTGEPKEGYLVSGELEADRQAVYIAGSQKVLDEITTISIPKTVIDITDAQETYTTTINLTKYLPEGTRFVDNSFSGKVNISIPIEKTVDRTFNIPIESITVVNVPENMEAEILINKANITETEKETDDQNITDEDTNEDTAEDTENEKEITMKIDTNGILQKYDEVSDSTIRGYVDIKEFMDESGVETISPGVYRIPIIFNLIDGIEVKEVYYADVSIKYAEQQ